jgi:hypothetical protein
MTISQLAKIDTNRAERRKRTFVQDPDHDIVQGAEAIAEVINASKKFVYDHKVELGLTQIGTRLFGSRKKLLEKVGGA